jgi:hypothetical protein
MKKTIRYALLMILIIGCWSDVPSPTQPIIRAGNYNLGLLSTAMLITNTTGPITSGNITINMTLTVGAMYSLQLMKIDGTVVTSHGFTATQVSMSKAMDYTAIPEGNYDLTLMDVSGRVMRVPVIIQR